MRKLLLIDRVFELLGDLKWHDVREIMEKFSLHYVQVIALIIFLEKYGFIKVNAAYRRVKLSLSTFNFIREIRAVEDEMVQVEMSSFRF